MVAQQPGGTAVLPEGPDLFCRLLHIRSTSYNVATEHEVVLLGQDRQEGFQSIQAAMDISNHPVAIHGLRHRLR